MKGNKIKMFSLLMMIGLIFQACSKDESITEEINQVARDNRDGNGNPGNGDPGNGNNIANLDNDLVYDWTKLMLELERYAAGMRPNASARALAYIYLASYETAVPNMPNYISNAQRLNGLQIDAQERDRRINTEIALNHCFAKTLDHFLLNVPASLKERIEDLEDNIEAALSDRISNRTLEESKEWGAYVANQVIAYSQTDESAEAQILEPQPTAYEPPVAAGYWTYSADPERALFPYWGSVRTFVISSDETSSVPPIEYNEDTNSSYFAQMMEVYQINNTAKEEDNEQLWIAEFWSDDVETVMFSPPARQFSIANQLIKKHDLNLEKTLALYSKLGFSLNDAAVSTWNDKYEYMVMRPNVFIHEFIDPDYQTNLYRLIYWPNPSFPGYPSGHSCFASAAAGLFIEQWGNSTNFTDRSHEGRTEFRGTPRSFNSFEAMAAENAFSRIPLGVHIRMDCTEGLRLGYEISAAVSELDLKRQPL